MHGGAGGEVWMGGVSLHAGDDVLGASGEVFIWPCMGAHTFAWEGGRTHWEPQPSDPGLRSTLPLDLPPPMRSWHCLLVVLTLHPPILPQSLIGEGQALLVASGPDSIWLRVMRCARSMLVEVRQLGFGVQHAG